MARLRRTLMVLQQFEFGCEKDGSRYKNFFSSFSSKVESPELPDWFKFSTVIQTDDLGCDDDFVLPSHVGNSECRSMPKTLDIKESVDIPTQDFTDSNIDKISSILNDNFKSPGDVVEALSNCSVEVTKGLVDKFLKRFGNDWILAFGFFLWSDSQPGYRHSPEYYDMMVDILGKCKQFDLMWGLVREMIQVGRLVSLVTMTKVMRRLAGGCRWRDAINAFHALEQFGIKKDTMSMNALLDALCKERSVKRARLVFLELRNDIPPNATTFNIFVHGLCKARKLEEAWKAMLEMRESGFLPCVITYTSLIEAYCLEKNFDMVYATIDEMQTQGCAPNIVTYTIVMHSLGKANRIQEALDIFDKVKTNGCVADTSFYNSLIYVLCKAGRLIDGYDVYKEMCKNGISANVTTYNTLISAFCRCSQEKDALELLQKMEENCCKPDTRTYAPLLKLCCHKQWTKLLLYLLRHMLKHDVSLDSGTYILLINRLCQIGELEQSCLLFKEMVLKGLTPKHYTYTKLLAALEREQMNDAKEKIQKFILHAQKRRCTGNV